jgi:DNA-binding HxlR family transcriptional regulator
MMQTTQPCPVETAIKIIGGKWKLLARISHRRIVDLGELGRRK